MIRRSFSNVKHQESSGRAGGLAIGIVTDGKLTHIKISKRTSGTTRASIDALIAAGKK
jgi:hypothetical protein